MAAPDLDTLRAAIRVTGTEDVDTLFSALSQSHRGMTREDLLGALDELADAGGLFARAAPPAEPALGRRQFLAHALGGAALTAALASTARAADVVCAPEAKALRLKEQDLKASRHVREEQEKRVQGMLKTKTKSEIRQKRTESRRKREVADGEAAARIETPAMQGALVRREKLKEQALKEETRKQDYRLEPERRPAYLDFKEGAVFAEISTPIPTDADAACAFRLDVRVDGLDRNTEAPKDALARFESAVREQATILLQHGPEGEQVMWIVITGLTYGWALPDVATGAFQELRMRLTIAVVDEPLDEVVDTDAPPTDVPT
jgi:hypothetical protein